MTAPGGDFKLAGAYVEVHLKDETSGDEKSIRARIEAEKPVKLDTALKDPSNTKLVKEKIEREVKPTIRPEVTNPIDEAWRRKIQAAIKATATNALDVPVTPDTEMFRRDLDASLRKAQALVHADIPVKPEDAGKFRAQLEAMVHTAEAGIKANIPAEVDEGKARSSARKGGEAANDELNRAAKRANAQFDGLKFLGLSVGLPAAATIGAVGTAAVLALVAGGFGALAVSMVSGNEQVQSSFSTLTRGVQSDARAMAQPLEGEVVAAIGQVADSWDAVRPAVQRATAGSAPAIRELTGAATDFAKNAMPGVVDAVEESEAPLKGFRSFVAQAGTGLSDFFVNLSKGGDGAGASMRDFGGITANVLGQTGTLLANLANGGHTVLPQFGGALNQVFTVANNLASNGMPLLTGTTSGFLGTVGGGLNIVSGFTSVLGAWAAPLGQLGGSMLATNSIAKLFGTSLGDTGFGLKAFSSYVDEAGNKTTPFKAAMDGAEGKTNKLKAGLKSVADSGFNPLGIALVAGGFLLDLWGQKSQEAAAKAAEFSATVADVKGTLSSTGAVTANTRAKAANAQQTDKLGVSQKTASDLAGEYHVNVNTLTNAYTGNTQALGLVNSQLRGNVDGLAQASLRQDDWNRLSRDGITASDLTELSLGRSAKGYENLADLQAHYNNQVDQGSHNTAQFLGTLNEATQGQRDLADEVKKQSEATAKAQAEMRQLGDATGFAGDKLKLSAADSSVMSAALAALGDSTKSVTDQGGALITILDQLSGKNTTLSAAQAQSTKAFDDTDKAIKSINDSGGKLKGSLGDLVNGQGGINGLTAAGANLQGVFGTLSTAMGTEVAAAFAQSQAAGDSLGSSMGKTGEVAGRFRQKFIDAATAAGLTKVQAGQLADKLGLIPEEVNLQFAAKGDQALQDKLLSLTGQIKALPDGKSVTLSANDKQAADALAQLGYQVVQLPDGSFDVFANTQPGRDAATQLKNEIDHYQGTVTVKADGQQATGTVTQWQQRTDNTWGMTTTDTRVDPASNKVQAWMRQANGTMGWTTLDSRIEPGTGKLQLWVQRANGTWGWVNADARTAAAEAALNNAARTRTAYIQGVYIPPSTTGRGASTYGLAEGGILKPNATGNILKFFAGGGFEGLTPMSSMAQIVSPNTWRVVGDNLRFPESYIPLDPSSARSQHLLDETNARMGRSPAMAGGGGVVNNITVHTAAMEPYAVAAAVSGELGWAMRGG